MFRGKVTLHPVRPVKDKEQQPGEQYFFEAFVRYGYFLFHAVFRISAHGMVEMLDDARVLVNKRDVVYEPSETPLYEPPFRIARLVDRPDFESSVPAASGRMPSVTSSRRCRTGANAWCATGLADVEADLRSAKCGTLNDNAARVWERAKPVRIDERV